MSSPLLAIPEAGRFLGYTGKTAGKSSVYKHIAEHRLAAVRINRRTFVTRESAERLIEESMAAVALDATLAQQGEI
jgi:hypothetical protein